MGEYFPRLQESEIMAITKAQMTVPTDLSSAKESFVDAYPTSSALVTEPKYASRPYVTAHSEPIQGISQWVAVTPTRKYWIVSDMHYGEPKRPLDQYTEFFRVAAAEGIPVLANGDINDHFEKAHSVLFKEHPEEIRLQAGSPDLPNLHNSGNHELLAINQNGLAHNDTEGLRILNEYHQKQNISYTGDAIILGDVLVRHGTSDRFFPWANRRSAPLLHGLGNWVYDHCFSRREGTRMGNVVRGAIKYIDLHWLNHTHESHYNSFYETSKPYLDGTLGFRKDRTVITGHLHNKGSKAYIIGDDGEIVHIINAHRDGALLFAEVEGTADAEGRLDQKISLKLFENGTVRNLEDSPTFYYRRFGSKLQSISPEEFEAYRAGDNYIPLNAFIEDNGSVKAVNRKKFEQATGLKMSSGQAIELQAELTAKNVVNNEGYVYDTISRQLKNMDDVYNEIVGE